MTDESRKRYFRSDVPVETELGTKAAEGAGIGRTIGGTVGAVLAVLAATAVIAVPGIGLMAAGPIAAGLAGAGAGGLAGTVVGAMVGWTSRKNGPGCMTRDSGQAASCWPSTHARRKTQSTSSRIGRTTAASTSGEHIYR